MSDGFRGVFPAMITPMTESEEVDLSKLEAVVEYLVGAGVHGLIPLGSTGEFYAMADTERRYVFSFIIKTVAGRVPVIAGVNAASTREVLYLCESAEKSGAAGVMVAPPYYSLPTPDELFEHIRTIDGRIGIPIMLYNYPGRTGVDMKPEFIERLAELKNVRYVKESTGETARISEIIRRCGDRLKIFCGCDTVVLESFVLGAVGWVAGIANLCPAEHVALYRLLECNNYAAARECFFRMQPLLSLIEGSGKYTQLVKAGCGILGREAGPPRRPLLPPSEAEIESLRAALAAIK